MGNDQERDKGSQRYLALYIWHCVETIVYPSYTYEKAYDWLSKIEYKSDDDFFIIIDTETYEVVYEGLIHLEEDYEEK